MPNLTSAPRAALNKVNPRARRGRPSGPQGWWIAIKVAFLLDRFRRRRGKDGSSPSLRQIALVVVSAGLAILVIRVASQWVRHRGAGAQAETQSAGAQADTQSGPGEVPSTTWTPANDAGLANESSFTDAVQSEISRHGDAPTRAAEAD